MLTIEGFNTRRVLVDNGSLVDVMYMIAFQQMKWIQNASDPSDPHWLVSMETVFIQRASFHCRLQ